MRNDTTAFCLGVLLLTGCVHTTISRQMVSVDAHDPYHKLLVCSISTSPERVAALEDAIVARLKRHRVEVVACHQILITGNDRASISKIRDGAYDGILVIHREPLVQNENAEGVKTEHLNLEELVHVYNQGPVVPAVTTEQVVTNLAGRERVIAGALDLLDLKNNRIAWSNGGTVEGASGQPTSAFIRATAQSAEMQLLRDGMIKR